jgi:hypothetical protein
MVNRLVNMPHQPWEGSLHLQMQKATSRDWTFALLPPSCELNMAPDTAQSKQRPSERRDTGLGAALSPARQGLSLLSLISHAIHSAASQSSSPRTAL